MKKDVPDGVTVSYVLEEVFCTKAGVTHGPYGPYWYGYWFDKSGRRRKFYYGKEAPPGKLPYLPGLDCRTAPELPPPAAPELPPPAAPELPELPSRAEVEGWTRSEQSAQREKERKSNWNAIARLRKRGTAVDHWRIAKIEELWVVRCRSMGWPVPK